MPSTIRPVVLLALLAACSREAPVEVQEAGPDPSQVSAPSATEAPAGPERIELEGGLVVDVHERGTGPVARRGGEVLVHYTARVEDAEEPFDSSWSRGVPDRWRLSTRTSPRLVEGLVRGLDGLPAGTVCTLIIPPELGYGAEGLPSAGIPPDATLVYEVRLLETRD